MPFLRRTLLLAATLLAVALPASAALQYRVVVNGLTGVAPACALPWGGTLAGLQEAVAYRQATVPEGQSCTSFATTIACDGHGGLTTNGAISGDCAETDANFDKVSALLHFDTDLQDQTGASYTKSAGAAVVATPSKVGGGVISLLSGNYIQSSNSQLNFGTGDFTVELWYYMAAQGGYMYLMDNPGASSSGGFVIRFGDAGYNHKLQFIVGSDPGNLVALSQAKGNFTGGWHHLAASRQGTTLRLYVDGALQATVTNSANINGNGFRLGNPTFPSSGYYDEVRITKGYARYTGSSFTPNSRPFANQ